LFNDDKIFFLPDYEQSTSSDCGIKQTLNKFAEL